MIDTAAPRTTVVVASSLPSRMRTQQTSDTRASQPRAFCAACKLTGSLEVSATHRASGQERIHVIRRPYAIVGRGPAADIRLDHPSVSRVHAFFQVVQGVTYCADLGSRSGVVWDDGRRGPGWLTGGRSVRVGAFDMVVLNPTAGDGSRAKGGTGESTGGPATGLPTATLEVYRGSDIPAGSCPLDWPVTLVGRHPSCRLRFVDSTVDYFHGCVVNTPAGVWWIDLSARKNSLVNGHRARLAPLRDGDLLELGRVTLVPRTSDPSAGPVDGSLVRLTAATALMPPSAESSLPPEAVQDMMAQFQQCVVNMAQMFATLQQEHAALMGEQLRQMQELVREFRQLRGDPDTGIGGPKPPLPSLPARSAPTATLSTAAGKASLADAHTWFLSQLAKLGQTVQSRQTG